MKHAYLIIAHNKFEQLKFLTKLLDHPKNDIYIFIDSKVDSQVYHQLVADYEDFLMFSKITFTPRINVYWGDYSQVEAEMICFKTAFDIGYDYYHLLSGVDLPLTNQESIHYFFEKHRGKIFLTLASEEVIKRNQIANRIKYKSILTKYSQRNINKHQFYLIRILRKFSLYFQKLMKVDKIKRYDIKLGHASNWVSIDHETIDLLLN